MLGASSNVQTAWLSALQYDGPGDLLSLFETANSRTATQASLHTKIRDELVAVLEAVQSSETGNFELTCADDTVVRESPGHDLDAAQLVLATARRSLLQLPDAERASVMKRAQTQVVTRARQAEATASVRYGDRIFTVRFPCKACSPCVPCARCY